jgi:putative transcriptional regulator
MPMAEKQLRRRDAKRDIGAELLLSVREMKAGNGKVVARVEVPEVRVALTKSGLPQTDFENLLGVLVRTL